MNSAERIEKLKLKLKELKEFRSKLDSDSLGEFNSLKKEICELLDDSQRVKFNSIEFHSESVTYHNEDDLPF